MGLRVGQGKSKLALTARMGFAGLIGIALLVLSTSPLPAQKGGHTTVRHHRVQDQDPTNAKLTAAEEAISKQDYATAEPLLKQVVAERPDDYAAWYDLGYLYHALKRNDAAIEAYRKSVQAKPTVFESNLNLGMALAAEDKSEAEQYLRSATKLTPTSNPQQGHKRAWMALGHLLEIRQPQEAVDAFRQAAVIDSKDPEPHLLAGAILEKLKSPDAEQEFQLALSLDPASSDAMVALTNLYTAQKRFGDAENLLRKLITLRPADAAVRLQLGRMLGIAGRNEDAAAEIEAGLKLDPNDQNAQLDLAQLYVKLKKFGEAQRIYAALLGKYPDDANLHSQFGRALLQQKRYGDAENELLKAVHLNPHSGDLYGDLAITANENKHYPVVLQALDARAKYLPEIPMTYFLRATAFDHLHDAKQASRYYHEFLNVAGGKYPEQEWQAKHRLIAIEPKK